MVERYKCLAKDGGVIVGGAEERRIHNRTCIVRNLCGLSVGAASMRTVWSNTEVCRARCVFNLWRRNYFVFNFSTSCVYKM